MKKKIITIFSSMVVLNSIFITPIYATDYNNSQLVNIDDNNINILTEDNLTRGAKPPTGTSFIDLNNNSYNYEVEELKVNVYTNTFFKGTRYINVQVGNISVDKNGMANESQPITVYLYKKGGIGYVDKKQVGLSGGSVQFSNLDKDTLYYIGFSKATDTQIYSFSGMIY